MKGYIGSDIKPRLADHGFSGDFTPPYSKEFIDAVRGAALGMKIHMI